MRSLLALLLLVGSLRAETVPLTELPPVAADDRLSPEQVRAIEEAFIDLPGDAPAGATGLAESEFTSVLRFGQRRLALGDYDSALIAFQQVGKGTERKTEREAALAGLARTYRKSGDLVKAAATYERLVQDHNGTVDTPMYLLELGRTLRALGTPKLAIARFYGVLHAVIKVPAGHAENYRQIARTAQFEIAETHFQVGHFEEAARFFTRLNLLELAPSDQLHAEFKAALSRLRTGDHQLAAAAFRRFIDRHPETPQSAEARFQLASLLHEMGHRNESLAVTLELLRRQQALASADAGHWSYWQRRTGNQLGNEFYNRGDFASAYAIYRHLAELGGEPQWRLSILYQMGLCQERLLQSESARSLYRQIRAEAGDAPAPAELAEIVRMADWRLSQLDWTNETMRQMEALTLSTATLSGQDAVPRS